MLWISVDPVDRLVGGRCAFLANVATTIGFRDRLLTMHTEPQARSGSPRTHHAGRGEVAYFVDDEFIRH
jgi:hypothetical protein